ncbi:MAG: hypothetical protein BZ138_05630 [Methanosphaera sp. rholeuAM270]|nr:MAG: hypothetical protein BZ138_05630 [Methanosphaera sp. rholeuAM270]
MKVAVLPDAAMMIVHLVTKNGHEYLSSTNISEEKLRQKDPYDDSDFDENLPPFTMTGDETLIGNKYTTNEAPSGVRGRLSLFDKIIQESQAAIIIGQPPKDYNHMYNLLNELILFSCVSCYNHHKLVVSLLKKKNIPILEVKYPTTRDEIIIMIKKVDNFLKNLENKKGITNDDNLNVDLEKKVDKIALNELEKIIEEVNKK